MSGRALAGRLGDRFATSASRASVVYLLGRTVRSIRQQDFRRSFVYLAATLAAVKFRYAWLLIEGVLAANAVRKRLTGGADQSNDGMTSSV